MTRIAIVEDEAAVREQLAGYVQRYTRQYGTPFEVTEFADGMEILEDYRPQFDIIFLDVEMKHLDGMETARRIRERDGGVLIVFITNMAQYAIRGYEVDALDYVLKPVNYYQFCTKLSRAIQRVQRRRGGQVVLQLAGGGMPRPLFLQCLSGKNRHRSLLGQRNAFPWRVVLRAANPKSI